MNKFLDSNNIFTGVEELEPKLVLLEYYSPSADHRTYYLP